MCGICGLVVLSGREKGSLIPEQVNQMIDALMHRGPDDTGIDGDDSAVFGMTRLAIRGLSDGKQPIVDLGSGVMMACNGEIDNHDELREWLISRGRPVEQSTDVAVIPGLYLELGDAFVEKLRGAFAIAIWDPRVKKLLLVRDRAGERPLFFSINDGVVSFASLIAALVTPSLKTFDISVDAVHNYLQAGFFVAPETPFANIQKVSPGEIVTITTNAVHRAHYWRWKAYSLRFTEASYDEGHYAEQVANKLGVDFVPVWVRPEDFPSTIAKLVRQVGEPLADPAWVPSALLARRAAQDVRVALVGEGADELFGGYPTYFGAGLAGYYAQLPDSIRVLIRRAVESWPAYIMDIVYLTGNFKSARGKAINNY